MDCVPFGWIWQSLCHPSAKSGAHSSLYCVCIYEFSWCLACHPTSKVSGIKLLFSWHYNGFELAHAHTWAEWSECLPAPTCLFQLKLVVFFFLYCHCNRLWLMAFEFIWCARRLGFAEPCQNILHSKHCCWKVFHHVRDGIRLRRIARQGLRMRLDRNR